MSPTFLNASLLILLLLVPGMWLLFAYAGDRRRRSMDSFSGSHSFGAAERGWQARRRRLTALAYCLAAALLVVALARPAWRRVPVPAGSIGRDVLFLLDVSNSMLAEDLLPNRLARAKQAILDCVDSLEGDRVGLVIFGGSPSIVCPLTTDYGFFRRMLSEASPENVSQGGTRIGDAIRKTVDKLLDPKRRGLQDLVLITDGGDQQSQPEKAAAELSEMGVFLIVIGLGDEREGARIPLRGVDDPGGTRAYVSYQGSTVVSRLESGPLERMASASLDGVFLNAGTRAFHLGEVYHRFVAHYEETERESSETTMRYRDEFPWFLGLALVALFAPAFYAGRTIPVVAAARVAVALAFLFTGEGALAADGAEARAGIGAYREGSRLYRRMRFPEAAETFRLALNSAGGDSVLRFRAAYNLGNSYFKGAEVIMAEDGEAALLYLGLSAEAFRAALDLDPENGDAAWNLELARRHERDLLEALESDREGQENKSEEVESDEEGEDGEQSEEGEEMESDEEGEESEESGEGKPSDYSASDLALDLENQDLPPPMTDPEDIFEEEAMNNELRQKKGTKYQPVEKDW
ncbi:MAG: VWA domain-containing protein [Verrucomicrobiales bacterium]